MEDLSDFDWVLTVVDEEITWHEAQDTIVDWRLCVETLDLMSDLTEAVEFLKNGGSTLELLTLECQHWIISVQFLKTLKSKGYNFKFM